MQRWRDGADSDRRLLPSGWGAVSWAVRLVEPSGEQQHPGEDSADDEDRPGHENRGGVGVHSGEDLHPGTGGRPSEAEGGAGGDRGQHLDFHQDAKPTGS